MTGEQPTLPAALEAVAADPHRAAGTAVATAPRPDGAPSPAAAGARPRDGLSSAPAPGLTLDSVRVSFGDHVAVRNVTLAIPSRRGDRSHRPLGVREDHPAAGAQPAPRPHRWPGRGLDQARRPRPLRPGDPAGAGAHPDRHGLPATQPVPGDEHLRERRLRAALQRRPWQGPAARRGGVGAAPRRTLGRRQGPAAPAGGPALRRTAAAALHRPGAGGGTGDPADGRAVLGAGPDRHRQDRGSDHPPGAGGHHRAGHPQHVPGPPGGRPHRGLPAG